MICLAPDFKFLIWVIPQALRTLFNNLLKHGECRQILRLDHLFCVHRYSSCHCAGEARSNLNYAYKREIDSQRTLAMKYLLKQKHASSNMRTTSVSRYHLNSVFRLHSLTDNYQSML